jgi:molybdate transport system substrate-binding protein
MVALASAGCGAVAHPRSGGHTGGPAGSVTVLAAASLTESFTRIGKDFEAANPGVKVSFSFGGSSTLAQQVNSGSPADVLASASPATMAAVVDAGNAEGRPRVFARNQLVIAVPKGNPKKITSLSDLTGPGVKVALCAEQVPCGTAARKALDAAGVKVTPVTFEQDVKAALAKLKLGEVDAALVYRTDTRSAAAVVDGVEFAESGKAINDYLIVALKNSPNTVAANTFVAYVLTDRARTFLNATGFQAP